ncbi:MAG TPA: ABC transporter substrate-binding protein [Dehalococcoidia bacterium]|nr:ABC transporter substrate-binding protein [Dehalococcoidia bacterium]
MASAAAVLAACGGGDGSPSAPRDASGLLSFPVDTTAKARPGGTYKGYLPSDVPSMDPLSSNSVFTQAYVAFGTYPRLLKFAYAKHPDSPTGELEGDAAESFEMSGDKLQLTMRVRQGMKWDSRTPTNGRLLDADDVVFSWNKFARISPFATELVYKADTNPNAPVESISSPDPRTVIFKLKAPDASTLPLFAYQRGFWVMPRESDGGFDPKGEVRGYGPWLLADHKPSASFTWSKNPDYYVRGRPFYDRIEQPIVPEYATQLAQFKAGNIYPGVTRQEDVVQTKRDVPALEMRQGTNFTTAMGFLWFGYEGNSPFKDVRVRQAVALLYDRETLIDVVGNRERFRTDGLEVPARYNTVVAGGWEGFWLDPQDEKKFGDGAKYFKSDPAEAKKLLSAAGFANGLDTELIYNGATNYGTTYHKIAEVLAGMFSDGGVRAKLGPKEYQNDWLPNYYYAYSQAANPGKAPPGFNGIGHVPGTVYPTVASAIFANMHKDGLRFHGLTPDGRNAHLGDPEVNRMIERIRQEFDLKKQQDLVHDFQRFMAPKVYNIPDNATLGFGLNWPILQNVAVYRNWTGGVATTEGNLHIWLDDTKPPARSA